MYGFYSSLFFLVNRAIMQKSIKFWFSKRNDTASFILIAYRKISMLLFQSKTAERFERKMKTCMVRKGFRSRPRSL